MTKTLTGISKFQNVKYLKILFENVFAKNLKINISSATNKNFYDAFVISLNEILKDLNNNTENNILFSNQKFVAYFSMEYLFGCLASQTLLNLNCFNSFKKLFSLYNKDINEILKLETSTQLGNGGLGRLAACFFDSFATNNYPIFGYGLFYKYGLFKQELKDNKQIAKPDLWVKKINPAINKTNIKYKVAFGGTVKNSKDIEKIKWNPEEYITAIANDLLLPGYNTSTVLSVRLWEDGRTDKIKPDVNNISNNLTDFLYPKDDTEEGKLLRLKQEYFLVSASLQDLFNKFKKTNKSLNELDKFLSIQLNDTHPSLTIPELIRLLIVEYNFNFKDAYDKTVKICSYTNHTLLQEALEKINLKFIKQLLPFHYLILDKIDKDFCKLVKNKITNQELESVRIIQHNKKTKEKFLNCGNLSVIASNKVNGVAKLHTELLKKQEFKLFNKLYPKKIINETNGISQRKWLLETNPDLANLISKTIGNNWITDLSKLKELLKYKNNINFLNSLKKIKTNNKKKLLKYIEDTLNISINSNFMVDSQIKRIHEYKRQFLNILQVIDRYNKICSGNTVGMIPKVYVFAGKAHPAYKVGIEIITLINDVAKVINNDNRCKDLLRVVFIPNYNIDLAKLIIAASEVSEQISTAGKEASGTGNMKMMINGALTIGTLDGANIEIKEQVGNDNIYIFGLTAKQIEKEKNKYNIKEFIKNNSNLNKIITDIKESKFGNVKRYQNLLTTFLEYNDKFMICKDFDDYINTQFLIDKDYKNKNNWYRKSLINIANAGFFSSDRTIKGYVNDIWKVKPIKENYE